MVQVAYLSSLEYLTRSGHTSYPSPCLPPRPSGGIGDFSGSCVLSAQKRPDLTATLPVGLIHKLPGGAGTAPHTRLEHLAMANAVVCGTRASQRVQLCAVGTSTQSFWW